MSPVLTMRLALLAAAATGVQVGAAAAASRFVIGQSTPVALALLRYSIGFLCLIVPLLLIGGPRIARRDVLPIVLLGIGQFGVLIALFNFGLQVIPAARAALIFATMPLLTMVIGAVLRVESLDPRRSLGVALSIAGVACAVSVDATGAAAPADVLRPLWLGDLAIGLAALTGALCSVLYRPYLKRYSAVQVGTVAMAASVAFLALLAWPEGFFDRLPVFTAPGWAAVVFIGLSSGIGYFLWLWALRHASPTRVAVFLALGPVTAAVCGWVWLGESLGTGLVIGMLLVAAGLWLAHASRGEGSGPAA